MPTHLRSSVPPPRHPEQTPPQLFPQRTSSPPAIKSDISTPKSAKKGAASRPAKSPSKSTPKRSSERLRHLPLSHGDNTNDYGDRYCGWPRSQTYFRIKTLFWAYACVNLRISHSFSVRGFPKPNESVSLRDQCLIGAVALTSYRG